MEPYNKESLKRAVTVLQEIVRGLKGQGLSAIITLEDQIKTLEECKEDAERYKCLSQKFSRIEEDAGGNHKWSYSFNPPLLEGRTLDEAVDNERVLQNKLKSSPKSSTQTDRELLELAAKAAGLEVWDWLPGLGFRVRNYHTDRRWHPLEDDGDAMRLSNKLNLEIYHHYGKVQVGMTSHFWCTELLSQGEDKNAVTRRAIVRAAAKRFEYLYFFNR